MLARMSDEPAKTTRPARKSHLTRILVGVAVLGGVAVVTIIALRFTLLIPFKVPSGSMWPGVAVGEHIVVNGMDKENVRGAVMVFKFPEQPRQLFVKRVVALAGDVVTVKGRRLFLNGWEVPHCTVGKASYVDAVYDSSMKHEGELEVEYLDGAAYLVFHENASLGVDEQGPFTVKSGEYFVMGDNRENAHDSRMWFGGQGGGVPFENTVGRVRTDGTRPSLPKGSEELRAALERCLATPPPSTPPPPARR